MESYYFTHQIDKEREGSYYMIPFQVCCGLEQVIISYEYKSGVVDIGLIDCNSQFLGWSGSAKETIAVGPYSATAGYHMTDLVAGEWKIIVGAYKIPDTGVEVRYKIEYKLAKPRWFTGDLHMHSDASDGQHDIATLARKAKKKGLDYIAVANHNNYTENFHLPKIADLTLLPAVEWTHYKGHMNFYGVAAPFDSFIANDEAEMIELAKHVKSKGALISVCHPKDRNCGYSWDSREVFDMVEVWNGPMRRSNVEAIDFWHNLLLSGKKIPLVGGSDYHRDLHPVMMAHPATRVFAESPSARHIIFGLRKGHSYVVSTRKALELTLKADEGIMGDSVPWHEGLRLEFSINKSGLFSKLIIVTSDERIYIPKGQNHIRVKQTWKFAYIIVVRRLFGFERIVAITNPIYFSSR